MLYVISVYYVTNFLILWHRLLCHSLVHLSRYAACWTMNKAYKSATQPG